MNEHFSLLSTQYSIINQVVGFIMDGNRRWAIKSSVSVTASYKKGMKTFYIMILECIKYAINTIIFYAMSFDNFNKRNKNELNIIFDIGLLFLIKKKKLLIKNKIRIRFIGDLQQCKESVILSINELEKETNIEKPIITVFILLIYNPYEDIFNDVINKKLFYSSEIPNIDLIIRTGGYNRLSGFLPIQSMNANIIVIDDLWPELTKEKLNIIFKNYKKNQNYGK